MIRNRRTQRVEEVESISYWVLGGMNVLWIILIVVLVLAVFGGVGYRGRR